MNAPRFSLREQRLIFITGIVILTGAAVSWGVLPSWRRWLSLREQTGLSLQQLERLEVLIRKQPEVEAAYQQQAGVLSSDDPESAQRRFLDELDGLAQTAQLRLDLKPRPLQAQEPPTISVEIDAEGTQETLLAFIDQLLTSASLIDVERLRISSTTSAEAPLRANLVVTKLLVPPAS